MDQKRFDGLSRSLAARTSRRQAVRQAGAGGLLGSIAAAVGVQAVRAQGSPQACTLPLSAEVFMGPHLGDTYRGMLTLEIDEQGAIDDGNLTTTDGQSYELVGQAYGRALSLRIELGNDQVLSLNGTSELDISLCRGEVAGTFSGPVWGDLGSWTTTDDGLPTPAPTSASSASSSGASTATSSPGATQTPTSCPADVVCTGPFVQNPLTCECECREPTIRCGDVCCAAGSDCMDPATGICQCPAGTEICKEQCTPSCGPGEILDSDLCECGPPCPGVECSTGLYLNPGTCECEILLLCAAGLTRCGDVCVDLATDQNNCGSCGTVCPEVQTIYFTTAQKHCFSGVCCGYEYQLCGSDSECCLNYCTYANEPNALSCQHD